jgi:hypothetical protein
MQYTLSATFWSDPQEIKIMSQHRMEASIISLSPKKAETKLSG